MEFLQTLWEYLLHMDVHLEQITDNIGIFAYLAMGFVVFAETAFVVTVFLPSDAVLFAACALASVNNSLNFPLLLVVFAVAAALGDSVNFCIGRKLRNAVNNNQKILFIKSSNLEKATLMLERTKGTAVVIGRFVPLLRSLAPFVTGTSDKSYEWFIKHNAIGVVIWSVLYCCIGYFFGNIPFVKDYFGTIVLGFSALTILTAIISALISKFVLKK